MKKIITIIMLSNILTSTAIADYSMNLPLDGSSITFKNAPVDTSKWIQADSIITDWINDGAIFDCSNWSPLADTMIFDEYFTQTATDCQQTQSRTIQDREQNDVTMEYRDVGNLTIERKTITVSDTKQEMGTKVVGECLYMSGNYLTDTFWIVRDYSNVSTINWKGVQITHSTFSGKTYKVGDDKYTRIDPIMQKTDFGSNKYDYYYQVCKH